MAEFCRQCSEEYGFPSEPEDLVTAPAPAPTVDERGEEERWVVGLLCEGCGPTYVDDRGSCVLVDCMKEHGRKEAAVERRSMAPVICRDCVAGLHGLCRGENCDGCERCREARQDKSQKRVESK